LTESVRWDPRPTRHRAQAYLDLLPGGVRADFSALEFWGSHPENELDSFRPGELERFDHEKHWPGFERVEAPQEPYWVLAVGATAESRQWPLTHFARLARLVAKETGWKGLVVGGPKEAPLAQELTQDSSTKCRDFTARGPIPVLSQVFAGARFSVTNESGLAHVASLLGSPVQIVCGAADPRRTQPIGPGKVQVAINPLECWPCERNTCSLPEGKKNACLLGISPDVVWEEIKRGIRLTQS
jgi:ADP-heptose:LPS heptosyltransferase